MDGVLPLSLHLSDDSARIVGAYVSQGLVLFVRPPLDRIAAGVDRLAGELSLLTVLISDGLSGLGTVALRVSVVDPGLLDDVTATRWAMAYFSYNTFLELLDLVRGMAWLDGRSHIHLHDIIAGLRSLEGAVAAFAAQVNAIGASVVTLLGQILDALHAGLSVSGTVTVVVQAGGLGDFLASLDLWKLLGLLALVAVGLGLVVLFLYLVAGALATFGAGALKAAAAVGLLVLGLLPLMSALAGFEWEQLGKIGAGFLGIALFVGLLGKAFGLFTTDLETVVPHLRTFFTALQELMSALAGFDTAALLKIAAGFAGITVFVAALAKAFALFTTDLEGLVPQLQTFFTAIRELMTALAGLSGGQLLRIAAGFAGITVFVAALGKAFALFTTDLQQVVPHLRTFFTAIRELMTALAAFQPGELAGIAVGFLLIAGFVWALGRALGTLSQQALSAMDPLARFLVSMREMATALAALGVGELFAIAAGFLLIAGFVFLLGLALGTFTASAVAAMPGLTALLAALGQLAQLMAAMSVGELVTMGVGLALVAAFVWAVAAALVYAAGPLASVATIVEGAAEAVGALGDALGWVGDQLGSLGDLVGGGLGDLWDLVSSPLDIDLFGAALPGAASPGAVAPVGAVLATATAAPRAALPVAGATVGPAGAPGAPGTVDQSVTLTGLTVNLNAERLEAGAGQLLTDEVVATLQARLGDLRATQDFRLGARPEQA